MWGPKGWSHNILLCAISLCSYFYHERIRSQIQAAQKRFLHSVLLAWFTLSDPGEPQGQASAPLNCAEPVEMVWAPFKVVAGQQSRRWSWFWSSSSYKTYPNPYSLIPNTSCTALKHVQHLGLHLMGCLFWTNGTWVDGYRACHPGWRARQRSGSLRRDDLSQMDWEHLWNIQEELNSRVEDIKVWSDLPSPPVENKWEWEHECVPVPLRSVCWRAEFRGQEEENKCRCRGCGAVTCSLILSVQRLQQEARWL